jgi:flagellar biosynthesis/type III secretory pathway chaperone
VFRSFEKDIRRVPVPLAAPAHAVDYQEAAIREEITATTSVNDMAVDPSIVTRAHSLCPARLSIHLADEDLVTSAQQALPTDSDGLLRHMLDKLVAFQALLIEEQQAIRSLSFGQFTTVTMRKSHLLDEIRSLEQQRRTTPSDVQYRNPLPASQQLEAELASAIGHTDRLNRMNGTLIGQSLEFLENTLRLWQRPPASVALYSSAGTAVPDSAHRVRTTG